MSASYDEAHQILEAFRYFDLPGKEESGVKGDRLLQPWITLLIGAGAKPTRGALKRTIKELNSFFGQPELVAALAKAGENKDRLLGVHLRSAAETYLLTSQEDSGYNSMLFGLIKLKKADREKKLAGDVLNGILLPLLISAGIPYRRLLLKAMVGAYLETVPDSRRHYDDWRDRLKDELRQTLDQELESS